MTWTSEDQRMWDQYQRHTSDEAVREYRNDRELVLAPNEPDHISWIQMEAISDRT